MHDPTPSRLPSHHISRARLAKPLADARLVVIEAAGGYGKSVLAAELVDLWGALPIWVALEADPVSGRLLAARLRAAVAAAGLRDAAAAIAGAGDDAAVSIDTMMQALASESCAIVIDDAHRADLEASALVARIADGLRGEQRLVVLARHLRNGLTRLRRAPAQLLEAADLALLPDETLRLCRDGFGLTASNEDAVALVAATGGWTAAAVFAASRSARLDRPLGTLLAAGPARHDAIHAILEEAITSEGGKRSQFARIAHPPLLDGELLEQITGDPSFLARSLDLGLPMTRAGNGWWVLPDPVREHLAALAPPDPSVGPIAAAYYAQRGELRIALQMLVSAGDAEGAVRLLDGIEPWVIDRVNALELVSVLDAVPDAVLDRYPSVLLTVARCCAGSWLGTQSARLMARVDAIVTAESELRRAIDVEQLITLIDSGERAAAEVSARTILGQTGSGEMLTRARTLTVLGQALCGRRDASGRFDLAAAAEAADCLRRASELQLRLGNRPAAATITIFQAMWLELPRGHPEAALEQLEAGLALAAEYPRRFVQILFCHAHVLIELGRLDDALADVEEVVRLARQQGDSWMTGYVAWVKMCCASLQGDAGATVGHAREALAEGSSSAWWATDGCELLADAADCLDRVGETALATEYLRRARGERKQAEPQVVMAECALLARHGDPATARERLAGAELRGIAPRERWRIALLDAYAAFRQGDPSAGALAALAFERAAELGLQTAPLLRERELTESLLGLAAETGMPGARELEAAELPMAVAVLGRFELSRGGRRIALGKGQETRLLKLVAVSARGLQVEAAIEALWPEVDPRNGRNRLRTVLNRLRDVAPEVVLRDGDELVIGHGVRLDLARFTAEAREALTLGRADPIAGVALARSAIARYRGPLLPSDPYEEWAEAPRAAVQSTMLELLDFCAETAARDGDLDEARRIVERTIELAPYEDHRYLAVASILHDQGRKGAALSVLRRARIALARLDVEPPAALIELEQSLSGRS
jgi:DNA-binding SARP family transcriptional activator/ATP/maltotriose-dependent transcriptional regulator MalT